MDPSGCVVLVPVARHVEPACEDALRELERRGHPVRRVYGYSQIDVARSQMATDALADGFAELMWVDADVSFHPDDVGRLRAHGRPLVAGVYAKKGRAELACAFPPGTARVALGEGAGVVELLYAGFGFVHTRRAAYEAVRAHAGLPECNARFGRPLVPYFAPLAVADGAGWWYLGEDYAFCERARRAGVPVLADAAVRLGHVGPYPYTWEDAGRPKEVYRRYDFHLPPPG